MQFLGCKNQQNRRHRTSLDGFAGPAPDRRRSRGMGPGNHRRSGAPALPGLRPCVLRRVMCCGARALVSHACMAQPCKPYRATARAAGVRAWRLLVGRCLPFARLIGCRAAAVCALLKERPRGSRLRVEHRARARPEAVLAARPVRQGGRAVAVCHGTGGRGGIPPGRAEDTGQAQVGARRSRRARRHARRNEVSGVLFASACFRGAVPRRRRVVACGRAAGSDASQQHREWIRRRQKVSTWVWHSRVLVSHIDPLCFFLFRPRFCAPMGPFSCAMLSFSVGPDLLRASVVFCAHLQHPKHICNSKTRFQHHLYRGGFALNRDGQSVSKKEEAQRGQNRLSPALSCTLFSLRAPLHHAPPFVRFFICRVTGSRGKQGRRAGGLGRCAGAGRAVSCEEPRAAAATQPLPSAAGPRWLGRRALLA